MKSQVNYSLIVLVASFLWVSCDTESTVDPVYKDTFIKYYGEDGDQEGKDLVVNNDGTIIILGTSTSPGGLKRMYLAKTDGEGTIIWERKLGEISRDEIAQDIEPIIAGPDAGNYIVMSSVVKSIADSLAIRLTIVSPDGDSLKSELINRYESQSGRSITPLSDGTYFISGNVLNADTLNVDLPIFDIEDVLVIRVPSSLVPNPVADYFRIGLSSLGSGVKIFEGPSPDFYYAGYSDELIGSESVATDYELNFVFRKFITDPSSVSSVYAGDPGIEDNEEMSSIAKSGSGLSYLAVGTRTDGSGNKTIVASTANVNFTAANSMQNLLVGAEGISASASGATSFLVVGNKINPGGRDIWLSKVDITLNPIFAVTFGGSNNDDTASAVAELPNGDIVVLGTMELTNQKKIALIKLKSNGGF
jgi:hypothetical protein